MNDAKKLARVVKHLMSDAYDVMNSASEAYTDESQFMSNCSSNGIGNNTYRSTESVKSALTLLFANKNLDDRLMLIVALEVLYLARDYCWERPVTLPESIDKYVVYDKNDKWSKDLLKSIFYLIESEHASFHKDQKKMTTEKTEKTTEKKSLKSRAVAATKKATKKAVVRKVSRRLTKNVRTIALKQLESNPQLAMLIASPLGQLAVPALLAVGLELLPLPESVRAQLEPFKDQLVEELTVQAIDDWTVPLEELAVAFLPAINDILPMLSGANSAVAQLAQEATAKDG